MAGYGIWLYQILVIAYLFTWPADHYQELYNIMLSGSSGLMSPAEHDLVLYNIMMIWFYLYNISCW